MGTWLAPASGGGTDQNRQPNQRVLEPFQAGTGKVAYRSRLRGKLAYNGLFPTGGISAGCRNRTRNFASTSPGRSDYGHT
jgi:hypothetical protein